MGSFEKGGQRAWCHFENAINGIYHTYDHLSLYPYEPHKVHIFLPHDYETSNRHYPCIYMNDGNTSFWKGGIGNKSWNVSSTLTHLYQERSVQNVIIIAVCPNDREYEYTHTKWLPTRKFGGVKEYSNFLVELKKFMDENYRTLASFENSMVMGSSHGGLAAFITGFYHPDKFGIVAALSPSFWAGLNTLYNLLGVSTVEGSQLLNDEKILETLQSNNRPKLYLTWGLSRYDGIHNAFVERWATDSSKSMIGVLKKSYNYVEEENLFIFEDQIGGHDENAWCYQFKLIMLKLFPS